jgi:hypothetical protein
VIISRDHIHLRNYYVTFQRRSKVHTASLLPHKIFNRNPVQTNKFLFIYTHALLALKEYMRAHEKCEYKLSWGFKYNRWCRTQLNVWTSSNIHVGVHMLCPISSNSYPFYKHNLADVMVTKTAQETVHGSNLRSTYDPDTGLATCFWWAETDFWKLGQDELWRCSHFSNTHQNPLHA